MRKSADHPGVEAFLEAAESTIDIALNGDVLADIPVVGLAFKVARTIDSVRDRALVAKLTNFARALELVPEQEREKFNSRLQSNKEEATHVGETLFLILDRLTDLSKPELLGQVFVAYLSSKIDSETLRRLGQAIDIAFPDDLLHLLDDEVMGLRHDIGWMRSLSASGLTEPRGSDTIDGLGTIFYEVTALGKTLRSVHFQSGSSSVSK